MKISVSYGETINTGNFNSKKIQIGIEKEYSDELKKTAIFKHLFDLLVLQVDEWKKEMEKT